MNTNYLKLKSCSNLARETFTIGSRENETPSEFLSRVQVIARQWGLANGSTAVEVSAENFACGCVVSQHVVSIDRPAPKTLSDSLVLDSRVKFHAVLEALQQYIDNGHDAEYLIGDSRLDEFNARIEAAEAFRDQLDAVLASLAG